MKRLMRMSGGGERGGILGDADYWRAVVLNSCSDG